VAIALRRSWVEYEMSVTDDGVGFRTVSLACSLQARSGHRDDERTCSGRRRAFEVWRFKVTERAYGTGSSMNIRISSPTIIGSLPKACVPSSKRNATWWWSLWRATAGRHAPLPGDDPDVVVMDNACPC